MIKDTYNTISTPSEQALFKDKNSKFYGFAFPFKNEADLKSIISNLKKEYQSANHFCYAYQIGTEQVCHKVNDDGEPNNSAGMPIYGQIQSFELTNILIVVIRSFGGVKLGISGLINAYRTTARMAIEKSEIIEKTINTNYRLTFEYKYLSKVLRILKKNKVEIKTQSLTEQCLLEISVRKGNALRIYELFNRFYGVQTDEL